MSGKLLIKYAILRKFRRKIILYFFGNILRRYEIGNFETILSKCQKNCTTENSKKIFNKFLGII